MKQPRKKTRKKSDHETIFAGACLGAFAKASFPVLLTDSPNSTGPAITVAAVLPCRIQKSLYSSKSFSGHQCSELIRPRYASANTGRLPCPEQESTRHFMLDPGFWCMTK